MKAELIKKEGNVVNFKLTIDHILEITIISQMFVRNQVPGSTPPCIGHSCKSCPASFLLFPKRCAVSEDESNRC